MLRLVLRTMFLAYCAIVPVVINASTILTNCVDIIACQPTSTNRSVSIHIVGQILTARYCERPPHPGCEAYYFFADKTGGALLRASSKTLYKVGDVIDLKGRLSPLSRMGYSIIGEDITVIGHEPTPKPVTASLAQIKSGAWRFRHVSLSGLVIDAFQDEIDPYYFWFVLCQNGITLPVVVPAHENDPSKMANLVGREIATDGDVHPESMSFRVRSAYVSTSYSRINVVGHEDSDYYNAPLLTPTTPFELLRRYCLVGRVLAVFGDTILFVQTADGYPIEVHLFRDLTPPAVGSQIRVSGLLDSDRFFNSLTMAVWRKESGNVPEPTVTDVSPKDLLSAPNGNPQINHKYHGRLIRVSGMATSSTTGVPNGRTANIECDGVIIPIDLSGTPGALDRHAPGTLLSITGICRMEQEPSRLMSEIPRIRGFSIIPRQPDDIKVIRTPPWWTPAKLIVVIGILLVLFVIIVLWNISLRLIAERHGRELFRENVAHISADLRTEERTRLAVDLHDSLAQMLTGVSFQIDAGEYEIASKSLKSCRDELRNCLWDLRNQTLEERDMGEAVRRTLKPHIGAAKLLVRFNVPRQKLSDLTAHSVLMIIRELVTNAVRHGHAKTIRVAGGLDGDTLMLSVRDDGIGFDPNNRPGMAEGHFGLQGIRERVKRCDGTLSIDSTPGKGTKVTISLKRQK